MTARRWFRIASKSQKLKFLPFRLILAALALSALICGAESVSEPSISGGTALPLENDLLSARCQSMCLYELEERHKNDSELKRQLKHHITSVCKDDIQCSSCILPCRENIVDPKMCTKTICSEARNLTHCTESCQLLERIHHNKPGICPAVNAFNNLECSAACDMDGDCAETQKCCTGGCSRECRPPILVDDRLLPTPEGITVQERKRKRSAIVRWIMKRLSPKHLSTNSNLFVIQWRWSVQSNADTMTQWQTITVRNKMYAILKHVLAPGRYYSFRVASVNMYGSYGFSKPSHPAFKLSRVVKAPSAPVNLTLSETQVDDGSGGRTLTIVWQPPRSDLPLKDYQLTWWKSSYTFENISTSSTTTDVNPSSSSQKRRSYRRLKSSANHIDKEVEEDEDYDNNNNNEEQYVGHAGSLHTHRHHHHHHHRSGKGDNDKSTYYRHHYYGGGAGEDVRTRLLPSYSTEAVLDAFGDGDAYIVELYASIESSDGELRGEPAILYIPAATNNRSVVIGAETPKVLKVEATTAVAAVSNTIDNNGADNRLGSISDEQLVVESALYERKAIPRDRSTVIASSEELQPIGRSSLALDPIDRTTTMITGMDSTAFLSSLPYSSATIRDVDSTLKRSRFEFGFPRQTTPFPLPPPVFVATVSSETDIRARIGDGESKILEENGHDYEQLPEMAAHSKKPKVAYSDSESSLRHLVQLKTPYFERGHLRTSLSWLYHPFCTQSKSNASSDFVVRISSGSSSGGSVEHLCRIELPPQEFRVRFCVANLENLQFGCEYQVQVKELHSGQFVTRMRFTTAPCQLTPSDVPLNCGNSTDAGIDELASLQQSHKRPHNYRSLVEVKPPVTITTSTILPATTTRPAAKTLEPEIRVSCRPPSPLVIECNWHRDSSANSSFKNGKDGALVGYRIILQAIDSQSPLPFDRQVAANFINDDSALPEDTRRQFVSVVGPAERRVRIESLLPATVYRFRVQPLTVHGLGAQSYETEFRTSDAAAALPSRRRGSGDTAADLTHSIDESDAFVGGNALDAERLIISGSISTTVDTMSLCFSVLLVVFYLFEVNLL